ncbi:AAA family ATPase [Bacillus cereus]|uniref:AAA family ATPase n=1 Tax=Bacillus cereus TaxID=1396 RepID=UPI000BF82EEF|nr:AAA family ATPase [Bacillus cereus]PEY50976.1 hypothetical protein CN348_18125 [Bacillus cereus]PFE43196.1 hypothetical protein CN294_07855 [Bacillus cereus]PFK45225.1 hypothetical protein COJ20_05605 [Bacillus cereus]PFU54218.1 hypothetical protein COK88_05615 [Bacillus cereus]
MLKIEGLDIIGVNGIKTLRMSFTPGINIICGQNGIGKTTILECIASALKNKKHNSLKKNLNVDDSFYFIYGYNNRNDFYNDIYLDESNTTQANKKISTNFLYFTIHRTQVSSFYGNKLSNIQRWFGKMFMKEHLSPDEYADIQMSIECFRRLDPGIQFSRVILKKENTDKNNKSHKMSYIPRRLDAEILVKTYDGEMPLNYLSAGYLSCLSIFLEIIKKAKTEAGFNRPIQEYDGVILIDEIDLHLHPEWQKKVLEILRWMVPNAQIIATTHSPHIVQVTKANEVIVIKNNHGSCHAYRNNSDTIYGYQGWSIEEILEDVMGLQNTHSDLYNELLTSIENSIDKLEIEKASIKLTRFKQLLHPNNHLGKILGIQIASTRSKTYDKD